MPSPLHEMKESDIEFYEKEFLHNNWHYAPGYYFLVEDGTLFGPFLSYEQSKVAWRLYLDRLLAGTLPSQTGIPPTLDS
jgi:hypothetical protein